ncbi:MAG: acetyl-CoA carboxylase biotin carboxyl carrier protein subunit [Chitinophagaceae bacterium]
MENKCRLLVNAAHTFHYDQANFQPLDAAQIQSNEWHVLHEHKAFKIQLLSKDLLKKQYVIAVNNRTYQVQIADGLDLLIQQLGFTYGTAKQVNAIKAPMPGLILDIMVKEGDEVQENDALLILEAMKMENCILSPRSGTIKKITVNKGNAVDKGHLLIEFQ